ncbi:acetylornithine deacetylase [Erythrobacter sp.]|jgi:acetylornithine deacetylase|uniref:acetylornithine deacetylase n=1 Tax=Erythrobacter sp. TaxID=1042 RepID=UPI002EABC165|nr:acetylornithine deacetylase [Erythrobacter sp.]
MTSEYFARSLELLERFVAFDTTSRNSNLEAIAWIETYLESLGIEARRIENTDGTKANLVATIGPDAPGGIILSGHSDVVPVDGQRWLSDPWMLTEREGRLYGRGTSDMKGFLSLVLGHAALFQRGSRPVHLAISYDEEVGCQGAPAMIELLRKDLANPAAAIIGEPSMMEVIDGHKGIAVYEVEVRGVAAHSSLPELGVSANMAAIKLLSALDELAEALARTGEAEDVSDNGFSPPYPTLTVGIIEGGTAANILAERATFTFDLRVPPGSPAAEILRPFVALCDRLDADLKARHPQAGVTMTRIADAPALSPAGNEDAAALVRRLVRTNAPPSKVSYAAEAGQFSEAGFSTVICGPGSIEQAHQPDEFIARSQLEAGALFMQALADELR